ncbi:hypothetical protein C5167_014606 [Papaver somniferum]|uniref:Uncharacterized protein n=1 Tax=Papaver somniferum TaxID=3469 RepID=A0A4Y7J6R8_PAPSO|nr:hypothetical protein C5167_014606 [Papaver somniferum]
MDLHHQIQISASKIANEITVGQRFAAYMVIPMRQEGVPTSCSTQKVLLGQVPDIVGGAVAGDSVALHCSLYSYLCEYEGKAES